MQNGRVQDQEQEEEKETEEVGKRSPVINVHFALIAEVCDARPQHLPVCKGRKYSSGIGEGLAEATATQQLRLNERHKTESRLHQSMEMGFSLC